MLVELSADKMARWLVLLTAVEKVAMLAYLKVVGEVVGCIVGAEDGYEAGCFVGSALG